jgi:hypothetical protein
MSTSTISRHQTPDSESAMFSSWQTRCTSWLVAVLASAFLVGAAAPGASAAEFGIVPGSFFADTRDPQTGEPVTQAGAHPGEATTSFSFTRRSDDPDNPQDAARNIFVDLPNGFVGNPEATPRCSRAVFDAFTGTPNVSCPLGSQVGFAVFELAPGGPASTNTVPLFNMEPLDGNVAEFAFAAFGVRIRLIPEVDPARNYGLRVRVDKVSQGLPVVSSKVTLWGVPSDSSNDGMRDCYTANAVGWSSCAVGGVQRAPFLSNPSLCGDPLTTKISLDSWQNPGVFARDSYTTASGVTGCDRLLFSPTASFGATTTTADAPTGLSVDLDLPQNDDPGSLATPPLRTAKVTLPEGMTINPGSADGLAACTDAQLGLGTDSPVGCPDGAKIGTVTATTPLLRKELSGSVYLRTQNSGDPESGEMFRLALVLALPERGLLIKLAGSAKVNKDTGQITTEFVDNPQVPVDHIKLDLKGGPRAPLATPTTCGTGSVQTAMSSWGGQSVSLTSPTLTDCTAGLGGFSPAMKAGTTTSVAGAFSPFGLEITKPDGNTAINGLSMTLPAGLLAKLKGNLGTQVGTVKAFAGPGSNPYVLPGQVYLEGQYGDAPFSLRVVVPAKAGPFDLGEVVVRQKIYVDPTTAQVTVVSDPVPTIVKGVPARLQRLDVSIDKPGFTINPTSCAAKTVGGDLKSSAGQTAAVSVRFQATNCAALDLKPELALSLSGKGQTTDGKHPAITANLTQKPGQANLKKVRVALPLSLALDTDNANGLCEFADGSKVTPTCPKASIVGSVTATTPILDEPLTGPVYFVKNIRKDPKSGRDIKTLPKLVIPLVGQNGVKLTLTGTSDVEDDQLVTTFDNIPDAPVSSFKLNINGGKGGILAVSGTDICKSTQIAEQQIDGQNNKQADADVYIQTPSCPTKILSKTIAKTTVKLKIGGLGAGKVTVTGRGIRKTTKTISKSTVATITAKRTGKVTPGAFKVKFTKAKPKAPVA